MTGFLKEHGFWDYTTPRAGGMEWYERDDYLRLLDDMAAAGMNSLVITVKWFTTGYRSQLPFLDQSSDNPIIASDNALLREVIADAKKRGIRVWLGAVVSMYVADRYGGEPYSVYEKSGYGGEPPIGIGTYDADHPGFTERAVQVLEEIVEEFPEADGLEIEIEGCGRERPHRIAKYDGWAKEQGRPPFAELGHPFEPRGFDVPAWRDYTTSVRLEVLRAIETALRGKGFEGELATILETGSTDYTAGQEINLRMYGEACPDWVSVTYEYDKSRHRYAMMDFCIDLPKQEGLTVHYLPRGVMTWGSWPQPLSLEESWRRDLADVQQFQPQGLWWFGSGAVREGWHVSETRLQKTGYADGVAARQALLRAIAKTGL